MLHKTEECFELSDDVTEDMRQFILLAIYGGKETTCAEARAVEQRKVMKKSYFHLLRIEALSIITWIELFIYLLFIVPPKALQNELLSLSDRTWLATNQ